MSNPAASDPAAQYPYPAPPSSPLPAYPAYPLPPYAPYGYETYANPNPTPNYAYPNPYPYPYYAYPYMPMPSTSTSGWAIASMVCGILGIVFGFCGFILIGSILAIIFGHISLHEIKRSSGMKGGRGFAIAGLVTGYIGLGLWVLYFGFIIASAYIPPAFPA